MFKKFVDEDGEVSYNFPNGKDGHYYLDFTKREKNNKIWASSEITKDGDPVFGTFPFTFDGEKVYNFWSDYPDKLTPEEKKIFDQEYPDYAELKN